jgi:UDP-N-acetylmuramoyl-tripeptide--D-alanyl-D-alanine ligase
MNYSILLVFFFFHIVRVAFFEIYLWQLKEYRFDRMLTHLTTKQGNKLLFNPFNFIKYFILVSSILFKLSESEKLLILLIAIYFFEAIVSVRHGYFLNKFPIGTVKSFLISVFVISGIVFLYFVFNSNKLLIILILDRLLPLLISISIIIANFPTMLYRKLLYILAKHKIKKFNNLTVIGITGSYGKTSTKEFLYTILSSKFNVIKTEGYNNTEISIARTILFRLNKNHQIFIVEMGAYRKGEIDAIASMVSPVIGIITGLNEQHLQLFGNIENTILAKFELIQNLKTHGTAIFNGNTKYVQEMILKTKKERADLQIVEYGKESVDRNVVQATNINYYKKYFTFNFIYKKINKFFRINLLGSGNAENILAAITVSINMGIKINDIAKALEFIQPPEKTMKLIFKKGFYLINDTFNSNPDGIFTLIKYMNLYSGKKVLILTPLIELGKTADKIHKKIGVFAASSCDKLILTNNNYFNSIIEGAKTVKREDRIYLLEKKNINQILKKDIYDKGVVAFSGKESLDYLNRFLNRINDF